MSTFFSLKECGVVAYPVVMVRSNHMIEGSYRAWAEICS